MVFEPEARAFDAAAHTPQGEYRRKVRTLAGNFQLLALHPWLLSPRQDRLVWQFVSHKLLRLAVPWALLALFASNLRLATTHPSAFYRLALGAQSIAYVVAALGWILESKGKHVRLLAVPCAFVLLNAGTAAFRARRMLGIL